MIESVADDQGILTILEEAAARDINLEPSFAEMTGPHEKALWTFLEHRECLERAAQFHETDELPKHSWRDVDGLPGINPRDDKAGQEDLVTALKSYFK